MINRYQGNSGKVTRIEERAMEPMKRTQDSAHKKTEQKSPDHAQPQTRAQNQPQPQSRQQGNRPRSSQHSQQGGINFNGIFNTLGRLLPGGSNLGIGKLNEMETEDIILLLILYLMYRESGDSELLMIMGAMFLL